MSEVLPQLLLVAVLIVVNAAFAGTELALVSLRDGQIRRLEDRSATGALLATLARRPNQFLATIQVGITLAGFLASAAAAVSLAEPLEPALGFLGGAARPTSIVVVTLVLAYLTLVFGELAPKRIAMQRAEQWSMFMARPLAVASRLARPAVWLLSISTDLVVRVVGADPEQQREEVSEEELRDLVAAQETFTPEQRHIIDGAFEISERTLGEVLTLRNDVFVVDSDWSCSEALFALAESGHTRAPAAPGRQLDQVLGTVHLRQLLNDGDRPVAAHVVDLPVFPDAAGVLTAMRRLQSERAQMALVVNEHGAVAGIVTMEDLVEELVGEIWDETDPDLATVRRDQDGTVVVPGRFPIHDLADIDVELPEGRYTTVAGFLLQAAGRFPNEGDVVVVDGWTVQARRIEGHAITEVGLTPDVRSPEQGGGPAADEDEDVASRTDGSD